MPLGYGGSPNRFQKTMAVTISKLNHFVFDGRVVSRTSSLNFLGKHRGPVQVRLDDLMNGRRGGRHAAFHLGQMGIDLRDAALRSLKGGRGVSM